MSTFLTINPEMGCAQRKGEVSNRLCSLFSGYNPRVVQQSFELLNNTPNILIQVEVEGRMHDVHYLHNSLFVRPCDQSSVHEALLCTVYGLVNRLHPIASHPIHSPYLHIQTSYTDRDQIRHQHEWRGIKEL